MPATPGRMAGPQLANDTKLGRILHIFLKGDTVVTRYALAPDSYVEAIQLLAAK